MAMTNFRIDKMNAQALLPKHLVKRSHIDDQFTLQDYLYAWYTCCHWTTMAYYIAMDGSTVPGELEGSKI